MKWQIPAKTFLLGEYSALAEGSAIILTTTPYFELSLTHKEGLSGIHPDSPAGNLWLKNCSTHGVEWTDPYLGCGGLGASSAQFVGTYLAYCEKHHRTPCMNEMLEAYYQCSWSGVGLRPSGYDVIAQSLSGCVYINKLHKKIHTYPWVFNDLSFFLVHTHSKLATHHHLQETTLPPKIDVLSAIVDDAKNAFDLIDSSKLIQAINQYHDQLVRAHLITPHSLKLVEQLKSYPEVMAIKGCGALGADVLLIVTEHHNQFALKEKLLFDNWTLMATEDNLTNNSHRSLIDGRL